MFLICLVCCFRQETAYEMRISDWSSDVCSSDLPDQLRASRRGNDDIRRSAYVGEIHCVPVADDDRASLLQEQQGNRLAHDIGLADHDGPLAPEVGHHALKKDQDRTSVVSGKSVSASVYLGGRRTNQNKKKKK